MWFLPDWQRRRRLTFDTCWDGFAASVLAEAERISAATSSLGDLSQITPVIIDSAAARVLEPFSRRRRQALASGLLYAGFAATALGFCVSMDWLDEEWAVLTCIVAGPLALVGGSFLFKRGERSG